MFHKIIFSQFSHNLFKSQSWEEAITLHPELTNDDFLDADFVFLPVYMPNHWLFVAIRPKKHEIIVIDSKRLYDEQTIQILKENELKFTPIFNLRQDEQWTYKNESKNVPYQLDCNRLVLFIFL